MPDDPRPIDDYRIGSDAPEVPDEASACAAPWSGPWEDRAEGRPQCRRPRGHDGAHGTEVTGIDGRCRRFTWAAGAEPRVEPC